MWWCWSGHRTTDWCTWHSSTCHLPPASIRQIHQCRREREQIFNYAINCEGERRGGGFSLHQLLSFFHVRFLHFGFLVYMHFVSLLLLLLRCSAVSFCNEIYVRCAKSNGQSVVLTFVRTYICIYTCVYVGACIKQTHTNKTHSNKRREQNCKHQQQHNMSYFQHSDQNRDPKQNVNGKQ